jgi:hypothetical protein
VLIFARTGYFWTAENFLRDLSRTGVSIMFATFIRKIMKNTVCYSLMLVVAAGTIAIASRLTASDSTTPPACGMGCCSALTTPMANTSTNATPDLLTTCPVSGEKLGEMGDAFTFVYKNQEVKLCCKGCKKKFDADPEKYMKLIRAADKK